MLCPKCDADITESYEEDDPDVGIRRGYYCEECELGVEADDGPDPDDWYDRKRDEEADHG